MAKLNLGSGPKRLEGYVNIDNRAECDLVCDVTEGLPYEDNTVEEVRAFDFLEHIPLGKTVGVIEEVYRVLKIDGIFEHLTPSTDGRGAFQDPFHLSFWNINSWFYYTNPAWNIYGIKALFGIIKLEDLGKENDSSIIHTHGVMYKKELAHE